VDEDHVRSHADASHVEVRGSDATHRLTVFDVRPELGDTYGRRAKCLGCRAWM
jgi:hypothetical protein